MDVDSKGIYVGAETKPTVTPEGYVFPGFGEILIDAEVTFDVTHIFPKYDDGRAGDKVTHPLIVVDTTFARMPTKFVDDLDQHCLPKLDLMPPMLCSSGFDENDFNFKTVDLMGSLMEMDPFDIFESDLSQDAAVVHYTERLQNPDTYVPVARSGNEMNKDLNDFIIRNMVGPPVKRVLDLGSGKGTSLTRLERLGRLSSDTIVECVEPNRELSELTRATKLFSGAKVVVYNCSAGDILFKLKPGIYDLIIANNSVHYICSDPNAIPQIYSLLSKKGEFVGAFPNYDSLVFRPFYGSVVSGLMHAYFDDSGLRMVTDIARVRRDEPVFPFWKLMDLFEVEFKNGSSDDLKRGAVASAFTVFRASPKGNSDCSYRVVECERVCPEGTFARPAFIPIRNSGRVVNVTRSNDPDPPQLFHHKGKAATWGDFFAIRSFTLLATSKVDGFPGHVYCNKHKWFLRSGDDTFLIDVEAGTRFEGMKMQVEILWQSDTSCKLILTEDQCSPVLVNQFSKQFPGFIYLKSYYPVTEVEALSHFLVNQKEGVMLQGPFSRTAYDRDFDGAVHVKWDPTVDITINDKVMEFKVDGEFVRERSDKEEGNDIESIRSVAANITPQALISIVSMPVDFSTSGLPNAALMSYPFGGSNYLARNAYVGAYLQGLFEGQKINIPSAVVKNVAHKWCGQLYKYAFGPDSWKD